MANKAPMVLLRNPVHTRAQHTRSQGLAIRGAYRLPPRQCRDFYRRGNSNIN